MRILICFFLMIAIQCQAQVPHKDPSIIWKGSAPGGFTAEMTVNVNKMDIDQFLEVNLDLTFPETHQPQWKTLVPQLLSYDGFGAFPFTLINQTLEPQSPKVTSDKMLSQKLKVILSPQIAGTFYLTFYEIPFYPTAAIDHGIVKIISGIVPIEVTMSPVEFNPALIIASPMPLSLDLPIAMSTLNQRKFIKSTYLAKEAATNNVNTLHNKALPWQIFPVLITILILIMVAKIPLKFSKSE